MSQPTNAPRQAAYRLPGSLLDAVTKVAAKWTFTKGTRITKEQTVSRLLSVGIHTLEPELLPPDCRQYLGKAKRNGAGE